MGLLLPVGKLGQQGFELRIANQHTQPGVDRHRCGRCRGGERRADVGSGAGAGVEKTLVGKGFQASVVAGDMLRLPKDRAVPGQAEPGEVGDYGILTLCLVVLVFVICFSGR